MKNKIKQMLSVVMTVCMLSTMVPLTTYGADFTGDSAGVQDTAEVPTQDGVSAEEPDVSAGEQDVQSDIGSGDDDLFTSDEDTFSSDDDMNVFSDEAVSAAISTQDKEKLKQLYDRDSNQAPYYDPNSLYKIVFLDCGRKYFSVDSIKAVIDNAAEAGFNYVELGIGNDGLRLLLNNMELTVNGTTYTSEQVSAAIHAGNENYSNFDTDELSESEMNDIISYADNKGLGIIPLVNTPGHMDAILSAATTLTKEDCSYSSSERTIDVTKPTAVEFTQALVQKYINYFSGRGCSFFNMGADEYANDKFTSGSMGFGNLQSSGNYGYYVDYVNKMADMIKGANMTPIAFNDGIYFNNNTSSGTFDTSIIISYWSNGWNGYSPMSASKLNNMGFKLINTHGNYYWVLGKSDWQCSADKASEFDYKFFQGNETINDSLGGMFCIWCDYPQADSEESVINNTKNTITAFGKTFATPVIDTEGDVTVTAVGITGLTCTSVTSAPEIKDASKILAYDVKPVKGDGSLYTGSATVSIKVPDGWNTSRLKAFVVNEDNSVTTIEGSYADGVYTFETPHFSEMGLYEVAETETEVTPSNALTNSSIKIEYWITNSVVKDSASADSYTLDKSAASEEAGIDISSKVPETAYSYYDGTQKVHFWKAMRLDSSNKQTGDTGVDQTSIGTVFTHVRYYNNAWQYKTSDGDWHYFEKDDQIVAYYMKHQQITDEITAGMKDWGYTLSNSIYSNSPDTSSGAGQVALSFAVVYPDSTVSPENVYPSRTTILNYWDNRDIGTIVPFNNSEYNISKITVTDGKRKKYSTYLYDNQWNGKDSITWKTKTASDGETKWYDETVVWSKDSGTDPIINGNGNKSDATKWTEKNTAKLVLIYLEPVTRETNLKVKYVDDSISTVAEDANIIKKYEIAMNFTGENTPTFYTSLKDNGSALPTEGVGGTFDLGDDAYVLNSSGTHQKFNKNLVTINDIKSKYKSGLYKYVNADISPDGKTLTLHFNIDISKLDKQYVVDFGSPVYIPYADLIDARLSGNVKDITVEALADAVKDDISIEKDKKNIVFTPSDVMDGIQSFNITFNYTDDSSSNPIKIGFIPASTVYYEEGFAQFEGFTGGSKGENKEQTKELLGEHTGNYGFDSSYETNSTSSSGDSANSSKFGDKATFTFTGDGVDIYFNCSKSTSPTMVRILNSDGEAVKTFNFDTIIGSGSTNATIPQSNLKNAYGVPVISVTGLNYDTYTVKISQLGAKDKRTGLSFDGFRVYNTMSRSYDYPETEKSPKYLELRNKVLAAADITRSKYSNDIAEDASKQIYDGLEKNADAVFNAVVYTDENTRYTTDEIQDLLDNGPKNEIYLYEGQSIQFNLNAENCQIGLKGVDGVASCTVGNKTYNSIPTTDMFYDISKGIVKITNTNHNGVALAITKIKYFGDISPQNVVGELSVEAITATLLSMGYAAKSSEVVTPEPSVTVTPEPSVTVTPEPSVTVTPEPSVTVTPEPSVTVTPEPSITVTPSATPTQKPEKPVKLSAPKLGKVVSESYNSVKVTWNKVKNADGYRIYMKQNGKWKSIGKVDSISYVCKGLQIGKKYTFTVRAYKKTSNGVVLSAYDKKGISGSPKLSTPVLKSAKRSASGVTFTWKKTAGATGYAVYRKANNGTWRAVARVTKGTTYKDSTAKKGVKYTYTVRAFRKSGAANIYSDYNAKGISVK